MIIDTDVLIWFFRGSSAAERLISKAKPRRISIVTHMEIIQGARDKKEISIIKDFLSAFDFEILPLSEKISHSAASLIEQYSLTKGLRVADALIAATILDRGDTLLSGNAKHFKQISGLEVESFKEK